MDELDALGKDQRLHQAVTGRPALLCALPTPPPQVSYPPEPWSGSAPPGGPVGLPSLPAALQHTALRAVAPGRGGRGAGHEGCGRTPPRVLTSARGSVRPSSVCSWDCGAGEAPTDAARASPRPEPPDLRWPRAGAPGPGDRRRAGGRRRLLRGAVGRGGGVCRAPPGGDLGAIIWKNKGSRGRLGAPRA